MKAARAFVLVAVSAVSSALSAHGQGERPTPFFQPFATYYDVPHPVYPVPLDSLEPYLVDWVDDLPLWVALRPSWLDAPHPMLTSGELDDFVADVAKGLQWGSGTASKMSERLRVRPVSFSYKLSVGDRVLAEGIDQVVPGRVKLISDVTSHASVGEISGVIAQAIGLLDPSLQVSFGGTSIALELLPVPGLGWQVELALVRSEVLDAEQLDLGVGFNARDRDHLRLSELGTSLVCASGRPIRLTAPGMRADAQLVLVLEVLGDNPEALVSSGDEVVCVVAPTVVGGHEWEGEDWDVDYGHDRGFVAFEGPTAQGRAMALVHEAQRLARTTPMRIDVTRRQANGEDLRIGSLSLDARDGVPIRFARGEITTVIGDWDADVAQGARLADPDFAHIFSGLRGFAALRATEGGPPTVDLFLEVSQVDVGEPVAARLGKPEQEKIFASSHHASFPAIDVVVDRPEIARQVVRGEFVTDDDGHIVIQRSWSSSGIGSVRVEIAVGSEE